MILYIIDAFAENLFQGNPAGVIIYDHLEDGTMQKLARELNFSETAFVKLGYNNNFNLRYFTPVSEIDFCGHATLAAYQALLDCGLVEGSSCMFSNNCNYQFIVYNENDHIIMEQASPKMKSTLTEDIDLDRLSEILKIDKKCFGDNNYDLKPQIVYTGLNDILLPVKSKEALDSMCPNFNQLSLYSQEKNVVGIHAFTLDGDNYTALCRNFAPLYGIDEESATGSSSGALAYYLYKHNVKSVNGFYNFSQGTLLGRPSNIICEVKYIDNNTKIFVGGKCKIFLKCNISI